MDLLTREVTQMTDGQAPKGLRAGMVWTRDDAAIAERDDWAPLEAKVAAIRRMGEAHAAT